MLTVLLTVVHVIVCIFLIVVVLLQSSKSADIAAAFGGAASQTAFGPRGTATLLSKATTWSAVIFMLTSITLSILAYRTTGTNSVLGGTQAAPTQQQQKQNPAKSPAPPTVPEPQPLNPR